MERLENNILQLAKQNLRSDLKKLNELNESAITQVLQPYLTKFDNCTPKPEGNFSKKSSNVYLYGYIIFCSCYPPDALY
jgi:hypothetical protein